MFFRTALASLILALAFGSAFAQSGASRADVDGVVKSLAGSPAGGAAPRIYETPDHYIRFIGAPRGAGFKPNAVAKSASPEDVAREYLAEHGRAFGVKSARQGYSTDRVTTGNGFTYVRLQQKYGQLPVFGAQALVQVDGAGAVQAVLGDLQHDTKSLDEGALKLTPTVNRVEAQGVATSFVSTLYPNVSLVVIEEPVLSLYEPSVLDESGPARLVWLIVVTSPNAVDVKEQVLVDAHSKEIPLHFTLIEQALKRAVYDSFSTDLDPGVLRRREGQVESGIADVDNVYDFFGDTYNFYFDEHDRDSMDGGGMELSATVRFCPPFSGCPFENAFWNGSRMYFGEGYAVDDVTAHELTHGVTQHTSNLI